MPVAQIFSVVTFYALFNLEPQGDHTICICRGTACHTRGSRNLLQRLRLELGLPEESEERRRQAAASPRPTGKFSLRTVACFGQCALAPVVEVDHAIFGHMNERTLHREVEHLAREESVTRIQDIGTFNAVREAGLAKLLPRGPRIGVGMGTCGAGNGAEGVYHAFAEAIDRHGRDVKLASVGCFGFCAQEPLVNVRLPGKPLVILRRVQASDVQRILDDIAVGHGPRRPGAVQDRRVGPPDRARRVRHRLPEDPFVARSALLQAAEEDRAAQLRPDQPGRYRRVHRRRRLPGAYIRC